MSCVLLPSRWRKPFCSLSLIQPGYSGYVELIKKISATRDLAAGKATHARIIKDGFGSDRFLMNLLIGMYSSCGCMSEACQVFEAIDDKNEYSWAMMLSANAHNGYDKEVVAMYRRMHLEGARPGRCHYSMALKSCSSMRDLVQGKRIHKEAIVAGCEEDLGVATDLLTMYKRCGRLDEARKAFDSLSQRDLVLWTSMVAAYAQNGQGKHALQMFKEMDLEGVKPDRVTFVSLVDACASMSNPSRGRAVHERVVVMGLERDLVIATALLHMYAKYGNLQEARLVFDTMPYRNVVSWNAMIAAYAQFGDTNETLDMLKRMDQEGVRPDRVTFPSILDACTRPSALAHGKAVHHRVVALGFNHDIVIESALLNMYAKCGKVEEAKSIFSGMKLRNLVSWNTLITAYAHNGYAKNTVGAFLEMSLEGLWPDEITFLSVISACSHAGMMSSGVDYFALFVNDYKVQPSLEHFGCLIDLLGRGGKLEEAEDAIGAMPFQPDNKVWTAFLSACSNHQQGARLVFDSFPDKSGLFVLLSNLSRTIDSK